MKGKPKMNHYTNKYNIIHDHLGESIKDSMLLGNGDIGINAWVEEDGDILFQIGKTDSWDENMRLLKLGIVRVSITPNPFVKATQFIQELVLENGELTICVGKDDNEIKFRLWVDANYPAIRLEANSKSEFVIRATFETWRNKKRTLSKGELSHSDVYNYTIYAGDVDGEMPEVPQTIAYSDSLSSKIECGVAWYHYNQTSSYPITMKLQNLESVMEKCSDPLLNKIFGGVLTGENCIKVDDYSIQTATPNINCRLNVYALTMQVSKVEDWEEKMLKVIDEDKKISSDKKLNQHYLWWENFWNRSFIDVSGKKELYKLTRGYILQRYMVACSGRGSNALKFNGSIFTMNTEVDKDYRRWGGAYWFQNQRLIYWPLISSGDYDMMLPFFNMYLEALPLAKERTKLYYGHEGVFFPETMTFFGTYANSDYGWNRVNTPNHIAKNTYIRYYWQGGIELSLMMIDYYTHTLDKQFLQNTALPIINEVIKFYDFHYPKDSRNIIHFIPAASLETWHEAENPLPEIAGLKKLFSKLVELPSELVGETFQNKCNEISNQLPEIPKAIVDGEEVLVAGEKLMGDIKNTENPELYAIFPYRIYAVEKEDLEMAKNTYEKRRIKSNKCWRQDDIQAAYLGLSDIASEFVLDRLTNYNEEYAFPAIWGPHFDEIPDLDHGGVGQMALQSMILQSDGEKIILLPAWPKNWDVEFKLNAPFNTIVEGKIEDGRLSHLSVVPEKRMKDVINMWNSKAEV